MLVVRLGLVPITVENGPIEIAPGTHRLPRQETLRAVDIASRIAQSHRHSPALVSIRYVRRWYGDDSRDVHSIPRAVWTSLTSEQQRLLRFPLGD